MTLDFAKHLISCVQNQDLRNILILGGEPTLWSPLPSLLRWLQEESDLNIVPIIISNGVQFANEKFFTSVKNYRFSVGLSVKSGNYEQHKDLTKTNTFGAVGDAIARLSSSDIPFSVSVTVNQLVVHNLLEIAEFVRERGADSMSFDMCEPSFDESGNVNPEYVVEPRMLADKIIETYDSICSIFNGNITYQISIPFCLFEKGFIDKLVRNNQIISGCHVMDRSGVVFDTDGNVLLCNCLHHIPIGRVLDDFEDSKTFTEWWNRNDVKDCNRQLLKMPSTKCSSCNDYDYCCGGCPLQWFSFDPMLVIGT